MRRIDAPVALALALAIAAPIAATAAPAGGESRMPAAQHPARTAIIDDGLAARLDGTRLLVSATAREGEDWDALSARALGDSAKGPALEGASGGGALVPGRSVEIPLRLWPAGLGARALLALFPGDSVGDAGWRHVVTPGATPWSLAVLFTGSGRLHDRLRNVAGGASTCRIGEIVVVGTEILRPELRPSGRPAPIAESLPSPSRGPAESAGPILRGSGTSLELVTDLARRALRAAEQASAARATPPDASRDADRQDGTAIADERPDEPNRDEPPVTTSTLLDECSPIDGDEAGDDIVTEPAPASDDDAFRPRPGERSDDGVLRYDVDAAGPFAVYRLRAGETLYTHVVLRFTGILSGREVNLAAQRIARRSGITDVTDIAIGSAIRIPLADLLPEYLPKAHPRRVASEQERAESGRLARRERRRNLTGVHVIVDSGHGGLDPGAGGAVAWEDDHVYDIACRVMAVLADRTHASVHPLVRDRSSGHAPLARLRRDTDEELLTTPPLALSGISTRVAVNLRWMMANDIRRKLTANGVSEERIVFISVHADSLHESATGAMAYFPAARLRTTSCAIPSDPAYRAAAEANAKNAFAMTRRETLRAEGLSRDLGEAIIGSVRAKGLGVHGFSPVRGSIVRSGLMVPAVLRYNRVPASVLIEACNLNNKNDQRALRDPVFRQQFAEAVVDGLVGYFDGHDGPGRKASGRR